MRFDSPLVFLIASGLILLLWRYLRSKTFFPNKKRLICLLEKAEEMASHYSGGYSGEYLTAEEFHKDLKYAIIDYKNGDDSKLDKFYFWFAPTCQWDDFVGKEGERLANKIFEIVCRLKK